MELDLKNIDKMTPEQEKLFWMKFERELGFDSGEAALSHLSAGRPIYYGDDRYPDAVVKEHPDGSKQLVTFDKDNNYKEVVLKDL